MRLRGMVVVAAAVAFPVGPISAQSASALKAGVRVRVTTPTVAAQPMEIVAVASDSLAMRTARGDTIRLPLNGITKLEVSRGRHQQKRKGAAAGALIGLTVGALAGVATYERPECEPGALICGFMDFGPGGAALGGGAAGAVVGALIGTVVGAASPRERWSAVPLSP